MTHTEWHSAQAQRLESLTLRQLSYSRPDWSAKLTFSAWTKQSGEAVGSGFPASDADAATLTAADPRSLRPA